MTSRRFTRRAQIRPSSVDATWPIDRKKLDRTTLGNRNARRRGRHEEFERLVSRRRSIGIAVNKGYVIVNC